LNSLRRGQERTLIVVIAFQKVGFMLSRGQNDLIVPTFFKIIFILLYKFNKTFFDSARTRYFSEFDIGVKKNCFLFLKYLNKKLNIKVLLKQGKL